MSVNEPRIKTTALQILTWLVAKDYAEIERYTAGIRLSGSLLEEAISEYGCNLVMPPASELDRLDIVEIDGSWPKRWSVRIDLWTTKEGRSDFSLECTMIEQAGDLLAVEIDNLHVL